jgi:hypothetical protein
MTQKSETHEARAHTTMTAPCSIASEIELSRALGELYANKSKTGYARHLRCDEAPVSKTCKTG